MLSALMDIFNEIYRISSHALRGVSLSQEDVGVVNTDFTERQPNGNIDSYFERFVVVLFFEPRLQIIVPLESLECSAGKLGGERLYGL